jgi:hypothetical protein
LSTDLSSYTKGNFSVLTAMLYNCLEEKFTDSGEETGKLLITHILIKETNNMTRHINIRARVHLIYKAMSLYSE